MNITKIKKLLKEIENELPKAGNGKNEYHEPYTEYITIHLGETTFLKINQLAKEQNKPISAICRELIIKELEK